MCCGKLSRRQIGEKKDLTKAMKAEERRQKAEGCFPNLEGFRLVSLKQSKAGSERALALGQQDAWSYIAQSQRIKWLRRLPEVSCDERTP
jgi:hypothetical protein